MIRKILYASFLPQLYQSDLSKSKKIPIIKLSNNLFKQGFLMIIPCVSCHRIFRLDYSIIKPTGSMVRCSKCHHIFIVYQTGDQSELELSNRRISNEQKNASTESFEKEINTAGSLDNFDENAKSSIESTPKDISENAKSAIHNIPSNFASSILDELFDLDQ